MEGLTTYWLRHINLENKDKEEIRNSISAVGKIRAMIIQIDPDLHIWFMYAILYPINV
jgi:hypothetical protein